MENICPCCDNHCPADNLRCRRGREHFGIKDEGAGHHEHRPMHPEEKIIVLLRKCGHYLHHNAGRGGDTAPLLNALTADERNTLEVLLEKCLESWENLPKSDTEH